MTINVLVLKISKDHMFEFCGSQNNQPLLPPADQPEISALAQDPMVSWQGTSEGCHGLTTSLQDHGISRLDGVFRIWKPRFPHNV